MFPVDTIKTRMQLAIVGGGGGSAATTTTTSGGGANININNNAMVKSTIRRAITSILKTDGVKGLYRGADAPEGSGRDQHTRCILQPTSTGRKCFDGILSRRLRVKKETTSSSKTTRDQNGRRGGEFVRRFSSEYWATIVGDAVQTPLDTIKQRMQNAIRRELSERGEGDERGRHRRRRRKREDEFSDNTNNNNYNTNNGD